MKISSQYTRSSILSMVFIDQFQLSLTTVCQWRSSAVSKIKIENPCLASVSIANRTQAERQFVRSSHDVATRRHSVSCLSTRSDGSSPVRTTATSHRHDAPCRQDCTIKKTATACVYRPFIAPVTACVNQRRTKMQTFMKEWFQSASEWTLYWLTPTITTADWLAARLWYAWHGY